MGLKDIGLSGLSIQSMKKHPAIIPIYVLIGMGMGLAGFYTARLALKSPEVTWNRRSNPAPWNEYSNKQHKDETIHKALQLLNSNLMSSLESPD